MGEIADDCHDRMCDEMEERAANPDWDGLHSPRIYFRPTESVTRTRRDAQMVGRGQRTPPVIAPQNKDWKFIAVEKQWPFGSRDFLVQQPDLPSALKDFFENEWHSPFREDKAVPDYHTDVQLQPAGGWVVHGETQMVLIFCR